MRAMDEHLALLPVLEPSPNLVAQSRMRLDEELDLIPAHGLMTRLRSNFFRVGGSSAERSGAGDVAGGGGISVGQLYVPVPGGACSRSLRPPVILTNPSGWRDCECDGDCADAEFGAGAGELQPRGSGDGGGLAGSSREIRELLMLGMKPAATNGVRADSVALLAGECEAGHDCSVQPDGKGIRGAVDGGAAV